MASRDRLGFIANAFAAVGLAALALYYLTAFRFQALFTVEARQVDFALWHFVPRYMLDHLRYPASATGDWIHAVFPYLPSAAAMMLPLQAVPILIAFAGWLILQAAAFAVVIWAAARMSGTTRLHGWLMIALVAALLNSSALSWDFRNHNTNLIYLALVMLGLLTHRIWLGALLLASSFNFKLYSGALMIVLAWRREYRLAAGMVLAAGLIAVLLPMAAFGPAALPQLFADWLEQVRYTTSPVNQSAGPASLFRWAVTLLAADPSSGEVALLVRGTQAAWIVLVAVYFLLAGRSHPTEPVAAGQARLADASVALLAPLPLSTWFIPYQAVVMLPVFMLLLTVIVSEAWPRWTRGAALAACIGSQAIRFCIRDWDYRGAAFLAEFICAILALAVVRRSLMRNRAVAAPASVNAAAAGRG